jgi:hypothetical protein
MTQKNKPTDSSSEKEQLLNPEEGTRKSKFGEHPNSIRGQMHLLSYEERHRFERNEAEYKQDTIAMELWAAADFQAGIPMTDNYTAYDKDEDD